MMPTNGTMMSPSGMLSQERSQEKSLSVLEFYLLWIVIGWISAADLYLNLNLGLTAAVEENPIARFLLIYLHDDLSAFMGIKFAGTVLALGILSWAFLRKPITALWATRVIAALQVAALSYMLLA
jgi:hypothetical protein